MNVGLGLILDPFITLLAVVPFMANLVNAGLQALCLVASGIHLQHTHCLRSLTIQFVALLVLVCTVVVVISWVLSRPWLVAVLSLIVAVSTALIVTA